MYTRRLYFIGILRLKIMCKSVLAILELLNRGMLS